VLKAVYVGVWLRATKMEIIAAQWVTWLKQDYRQQRIHMNAELTSILRNRLDNLLHHVCMPATNNDGSNNEE